MFLFGKKKIDISVLVPVYGTENTLLRCLESVKAQATEGCSIELVVVDDCSPGKDEDGRFCAEIVKGFKKKCNFPVQYIRHAQNKGAFEARRTAVYASNGARVFMLDSDDYLEAGALPGLLNYAKENNAQIVHSALRVVGSGSEHYMQEMNSKAHNVHLGELCGHQIIEHFLIDMDIIGFMCGKLYDRELILNTMEHIPPVSCTMAEDYLQFVWLSYEAALHDCKYLGVEDSAYVYCVGNGITGNRKITDIKNWEKIVSTASVFTSIFSEIESLPEPQMEKVFTKEIMDTIKQNCRSFLAHNIMTFRKMVEPEIKEEAYEMLCDYWGRDFVKEIEAALENSRF